MANFFPSPDSILDYFFFLDSFGNFLTFNVMAGLTVLYPFTLLLLQSVIPEGRHSSTLITVVERVQNCFMLFVSVLAFAGCVHVMWTEGAPSDPWLLLCDPDKRVWPSLDRWNLFFCFTKVLEWGDTWMLVLKGKRMIPPPTSQTFLHVFHHTTTLSIAWVAWKRTFSVFWLGPVTNSFVHIPMYLYYLLTSVCPSVRKFGTLITPIQLVQFVICLCSCIASLMMSGCKDDPRANTWMMLTYTVFFVLFVQMFVRRVKKERKKE